VIRPEASRVAAVSAAAHQLLPDVIEATKRIASVAAPTGDESDRTALVAEYFGQHDLSFTTDDLGDVVGVIPGRNTGATAPAILLAAHLDTVFDRHTPLDIRQAGHMLHGPGVGDNSVGVASVLAVSEILRRAGEQPAVDIMLTGNVGEEGLGNLQGIRAVMDANPRIAAVVAVEGHNLGRVTHIAVGSRRLRITAHGPGGHSWGDFGRPNAIHALARLICDLDDIALPWAPKTTLSVGTIQGGISVNTIAPSASCLLDLRSIDAPSLRRLATQVDDTIERANNDGVRFEVELLGDRPAGEVSLQSPAVRATTATLKALGVEPSFDASSTDANIALSRGIPGVCIGLTQGGNVHRPDEYIDTRPLPVGMAQLALVALELADLAARGALSPGA
jgi:tripeptide aminopeptidase